MTDRVRPPKLGGRVAVITGAGSGLGRRSALLFAEEGARLVLADINPGRVNRVADEITAAGGSAIPVTCDISVEDQVRGLVETAVGTYGTLDVMFNNAGISVLGPFDEGTADQWRRLLEVNVLGTFFGCKHAIPVMKAKRCGVILNTSSAAALAAIAGNAAYAASKGAINVITRDLAVELGPYNIRVNALCSMGGMSANMTLPPDAPLVDEDAQDATWDPSQTLYVLATPRPPKLIDHANVALFLASDDAAWCSGVCLPVDGATTGKAAIDISRKLASYAAAAERAGA